MGKKADVERIKDLRRAGKEFGEDLMRHFGKDIKTLFETHLKWWQREYEVLRRENMERRQLVRKLEGRAR
jgi:hypothetical protein